MPGLLWGVLALLSQPADFQQKSEGGREEPERIMQGRQDSGPRFRPRREVWAGQLGALAGAEGKGAHRAPRRRLLPHSPGLALPLGL